MFAMVENHAAIGSLSELFRAGVKVRSAPELFCLDLYRYFDLDRLALFQHRLALITETAAACEPESGLDLMLTTGGNSRHSRASGNFPDHAQDTGSGDTYSFARLQLEVTAGF
jgi:hypothetical protein